MSTSVADPTSSPVSVPTVSPTHHPRIAPSKHKHGGTVTCDSSQWIVIAWAALVTIYCLLILSYFLYQFINNRNNKEVKNLTRFMKIITIIVFFFFFIAVASSMTFNIICVESDNGIEQQYNIFVGLFYGCALHSLAIIFIHRLDTIVKDSSIFTNFGKNCIFIIAWSCWTLSLISMIGAIIFYYTKRSLSLEFFGISSIMYAILSMSLLILFVYCLHRLARAMNFSDNAKTKRRMVKLVSCMTKYVICVTIGLISSVTFSFLFGVIRIDGNICWACDIFVNATCLLLQFNFTKQIYNYICYPCDQCLQKIFWGNIEKSLLYDDAHKDTITNEFDTNNNSKNVGSDDDDNNGNEHITGANLYKYSLDVDDNGNDHNNNDYNNNDSAYIITTKDKKERNPNSYVPPTNVQLQIANMNDQEFD